MYLSNIVSPVPRYNFLWFGRKIYSVLGDPNMVKAIPAVLLLCLVCSISRSQQVSERKEATEHYVTTKDPKWYARQIVPLRQELAEIEQRILAIRQARKDGRGTTGAVDLEKEPEGVTADAQLLLLQQRRTQVLERIGEIEDEARRNAVAPGAVRTAEEATEEGRADANNEIDVDTPEIAQTEEALRQEKQHLERTKKQANLLQRKLDLDTHKVYSSPEYTAQKAGKAELTAEKNHLAKQQNEIQQSEQKIAELEEHLQDLRLLSANKTGEAETPVTRVEEKDEAYWRKQFAGMRYKIRTAQSELDILQRELNEGLLIYDPNPQKAMRENVTRKNINAHRQAIEDKKKEIAELRKQLSDLEDDLRHAGGDAGWSRE
jgi:DNA repair exonuclease SbcCD ATPase subunit